MKKFLALALALTLCLGLAAPALALDYGQEYAGYTTGSSQQYRDVPDTHWAFQSIATCSQRSWFNGYPDGTFRPEGLITREEAAKVFAVAMSLEIETNPTVTYTDTKNNWAKAYIEATKPLFPNVANLQGTTSFRPTQTITREETIYALVVAWGYGSKTKNADLSVLNMFSDTSSVSAGVKPYLAVAVSEGLVSGLPDGTIAAQKGLTRAEFATLLARALSHGYGDTKQEFQAPKITLDKYSTTTDASTLTVTGTVTPADATVALDGDDVRVSKGSFSVELELKVGVNSFTLTAENAYGTKDSKTITVERTDQLAISINTFDTKTEAEEVTLTGTVTPPAGATLTVDGAEVPTTSTGAFNITLPLEVGANVFEFTAKNTNGSTATKSAKITREFVAPTSEPTQEPEEPSGSSSNSETVKPTIIDCYYNTSRYLYMDEGETTIISVIGVYSDGTTDNITRLCNLRSSNPAVISVLSNGTITACGEGRAFIDIQPPLGVEDLDPVEVVVSRPNIPATDITITNGYRYLFLYDGVPTKQIGGNGYEVHMYPNTTYQLDIIVSPRNTTDQITYQVKIPNGNPNNGGGITVDENGLIRASADAHGDVEVLITCGECKTYVNIIMCYTNGKRLY